MTLKNKVMDQNEWFESRCHSMPPDMSDIMSSKLIAIKTILMNGVDNKGNCFCNANRVVTYEHNRGAIIIFKLLLC